VFWVCSLGILVNCFSSVFADSCAYEYVQGSCTIDTVERKESKGDDAKRGGFEVSFYFTPVNENRTSVGVVKDFAAFVKERKTERFAAGVDLDRMGVKPGAVLECEYSFATTSGCKYTNFRFTGPLKGWEE
jgi:hypothetical protein